MSRQYLPPGLTLLGKQNVEIRGNQPPVLLGIVTVRGCTDALCACGSSKAGQCLSIRLCRQSTVLTACDHTAGMDPIVSNLWACVEIRWLLHEPGKDNTDLAFLVPTWLTRYRRGFNPVFAHVITDVRVVALHRRSSRSTGHGDGRTKAARSERGARCSRFSPPLQATNPYPANVW